MVVIKRSPKLVYDDSGHLVEVIISAEDFAAYLRSLAAEEDLESMPEHLQDAVDRMPIDEVSGERDTAYDLETILGCAAVK